MSDEFFDDGRDELGRWRPGTSGNPAGRPPKDETFFGLINGALSRELETSPGVKMTTKEFVSQIIAGILVNGRYTFLSGEEVAISPRDLLPFLMNIMKRMEPGTTNLDITSGGKAIDFSRMDNNELAKFIEGTIAGSIDGDSRSEEARIDPEDSEHEDESGAVSSDDSPEDVLLEPESSSAAD